MSRLRSPWLLVVMAAILVTSTFAQRLFITVDTGNGDKAVIELLPPMLALLAVAATVRSRGRNIAALLSREFLIIWAPYLALALLLPMLAVVTGQYPLRDLAAVRTPAYMASALVLGAEFRGTRGDDLRTWGMPLLVTAATLLAYAVLQQLIVGHLLPPGPWDHLLRWDADTQRAFGGELLFGRSSAFFVNPNVLGAWAGVAMVAGMLAVSGRLRYAMLAATFGLLVLSESRGAGVAAVGAFALILVHAMREGHTPTLRSMRPYAAVLVVVMLGWAALSTAGAPAGTLAERVGSGIGLVTGGSDSNLSGRFAYWDAALRLLASHPLGTLGSPEQLLGTAADSEWIRSLLQGSVVFVAALGLMLIGGALNRGDDGPQRIVLRALCVFMAIAGLTQLPLQYPVTYIFWALVGMTVARQPSQAAVGTDA